MNMLPYEFRGGIRLDKNEIFRVEQRVLRIFTPRRLRALTEDPELLRKLEKHIRKFFQGRAISARASKGVAISQSIL